MKIAWATDGENFRYESMEEAVKDLVNDGADYDDGLTVQFGEVVDVITSDIFDAEIINVKQQFVSCDEVKKIVGEE